MRFPLSWLHDYIELPSDLGLIQSLLMKAGIGLEAVEDPGASLDKVVVAKVLSRDKHPNADKLSVCQVSTGDKTFTIVCGAQNYQAGAVVPLALEGAQLGDLKIKRSKIRGQESEGMLCSAKELGLPEKEDGLMLLDEGLSLGQPLAKALGLDDVVLTLETTANRPDHLSLIGLARELAALGSLKLKALPALRPASGKSDGFQVATLDSQACPLYMACVVKGVKVGPSPDWLKQRLEKSGMRSINNVVDVTNYVLLEHGQPLHAFDLGKLTGGKLEARLARAGETLETLDHQKRELSADDIVIADGAGPQALGGVMGGAQSEVTDATKDVVLEAAVFKRERVRRTSRRLGLRSESSLRFERGVNAHGTLQALMRAASLLEELAAGKAAEGLTAGTEPALPAALPLLPDRINGLLGTRLEPGQMAGLLEQRGFTLSQQSSGWSAQAPAWRPDLHHAQDLAEEVLQMLGLEKVASTVLSEVRMPDPDDSQWVVGMKLRELCARQGLREASTYSYLDPALAEAWQMPAVKMDNPLSAEQSLLRPSLLPNLVECASQSLRRKAPGLAYFELGRVFQPAKARVEELEQLALVLAGRRQSTSWLAQAADWDYYDLKGMAERLAEDLGVAFRISPAKLEKRPAWMHPGQAAELSMGGLSGWLGALHPALLKRLDIMVPVFALELEGLGTKSMLKEPRYEAISRFPSVERDLSCLMPLGLEAGKVLDFLRTEGGMKGVGVKDRFEGAPLPEGKKSLTFSITYTADGRSLTDEEVNKLHDEICQRLETALPLEVRR